jgi:hypothetical protein
LLLFGEERLCNNGQQQALQKQTVLRRLAALCSFAKTLALSKISKNKLPAPNKKGSSTSLTQFALD